MARTIADPTARGRIGRRGALLAIGLVLAGSLYYASAAYLIRFELDAVLLPHVAGSTDSPGRAVARVKDAAGDELLLRRYGEARIGCAIFFPGQHGELHRYQETLFRTLTSVGVAVFAVDYPGQDGAAGRATTRVVLDLSHRAVLEVVHRCGRGRTVLLGRSLGSMVAAYAASGEKPAGIVLDSAAPSLSAAIAARLQSRWYLRPLALLPVHRLLAHDYSLSQALAHSPGMRVVVFQGTADRRTPLRDLEEPGALPQNVRLVPVPGATHANAYQRALDAYVRSVVRFLGHPRLPIHARRRLGEP